MSGGRGWKIEWILGDLFWSRISGGGGGLEIPSREIKWREVGISRRVGSLG